MTRILLVLSLFEEVWVRVQLQSQGVEGTTFLTHTDPSPPFPSPPGES